MTAFLAFYGYPTINSTSKATLIKRAENINKLQPRFHFVLPSQETLLSRRHVLVCTGVSWVAVSPFNLPGLAEKENKNSQEDEEGLIGAIKSLIAPNEKTKSGKVLPKAYLKSAREVVRTLRESLKEDLNDVSKFRRTADAAKESIREYLNNWKGQKAVVGEESYGVLEKAIRTLASFYSRAGPTSPLPEEVKCEILSDLSTAEEGL